MFHTTRNIVVKLILSSHILKGSKFYMNFELFHLFSLFCKTFGLD